jgi:hypothetical protein
MVSAIGWKFARLSPGAGALSSSVAGRGVERWRALDACADRETQVSFAGLVQRLEGCGQKVYGR